VQKEMSVLAVVEKRGFDLEEVRVILYEQLTSGLIGSLLQLPEQFSHLGRVEVVHGEPLMHG
jgi:hypothetical protein